MIDQDFEHGVNKEFQSPYCHGCGACGEAMCCPPTICQNHPHGDYCGWYFKNMQEEWAEQYKRE